MLQDVSQTGIVIFTHKLFQVKQSKTWHARLQSLYAQSHNRVDYVVVVLLQCLDSLVPRDACLGHDQFNILIFQTRSIDLLPIIFVIILLVITSVDSLALAVVVIVVMARVVVSGVVVSVGSSKLLGSAGLSLRIEILNLGLTKDT